MKLRLPKFAGEMDSMKSGILLAGGLTLVAGIALLLQWRRHGSYRDALAAAQRSMGPIATAANQIRMLEDEVKADQLLRTNDQTYITQQSTGANFGDVNTRVSPKEPVRGYRDRLFSVTALDKEKVYNRRQLATFFFRIESQTSRMRVTAIDLRPADPKRIEDDLWKFTAEFTSRSRESE